jgi:hypothetical protein
MTPLLLLLLQQQQAPRCCHTLPLLALLLLLLLCGWRWLVQVRVCFQLLLLSVGGVLL